MSSEAVSEAGKGAPPRQLPWIRPLDKRFVLAAFLLSVACGSPLGLAWLASTRLASVPLPPALRQLHGYVQLYGFLAMLVAGFAYHLLPRFERVPLPYPRWARVSFFFLLAGVLLRLAGTPFSSPRWWPALGAAGTAAFAVVFTANVEALVRRAALKLEYHLWVRLGCWSLLAACGADALASVRAAVSGAELLLPLSAVESVWQLGLVGFGTLFAVGVALRLLPPMLGGDRPRSSALKAAPWLIAGGLWLEWSLGNWELHRAEQGARLLSAAGLALSAVGFRLWRRRFPAAGIDPFFVWAVRFAFASLLASAAARAVRAGYYFVDAAPPGALLYDVERHLLGIGFLLTLIVAMASRLLPGLMNVKLRWAPLRWGVGLLLVAGVLLRASPMVSVAHWAAQAAVLSGLAVWLGQVLFLAMLMASLAFPLPARPPAPAPDEERLAQARRRVEGASGPGELQ